jgi:hypothetical protein
VPRKPTQAQKRVMEKTTTAPLVKAYVNEGEVIWSFSDGTRVRQDVAETCVLRGLVQPLNDGLFGDSQSYAMVPK